MCREPFLVKSLVQFVLATEGGRIGRIRLHPACIEDLGIGSADEREKKFLA